MVLNESNNHFLRWLLKYLGHWDCHNDAVTSLAANLLQCGGKSWSTQNWTLSKLVVSPIGPTHLQPQPLNKENFSKKGHMLLRTIHRNKLISQDRNKGWDPSEKLTSLLDYKNFVMGITLCWNLSKSSVWSSLVWWVGQDLKMSLWSTNHLTHTKISINGSSVINFNY